MYLVDLDKKTCQETPLSGPMQPIEVPADAHFIAEEYIGVEGLIGAGFQTELWAGTTQHGMYRVWFKSNTELVVCVRYWVVGMCDCVLL